MSKLPIPQSYTLNKANVKRFLNAIEDDDIRGTMRTLLDNTIHISYKEFLDQINKIVPQVINYVPTDRPVFVFVDSNFSAYFYKSNYWMFMLIKNTIIHKYDKKIKLVTSLDDKKIQENDIILLIDDCIYSGIQISTTIKNMQNTYNKKLNIMLFVPYVSKAGLILINKEYQSNTQLKKNCAFLIPKSFNIIRPFGEYIEKSQAEKLAGYYHHLNADMIREAYPIYFDHKVAKFRSSFPAVYAGIVPNYNNREQLYYLVSQFLIGLGIGKYDLYEYKKQGVKDEKKLKEILDYIKYNKKLIKQAELKMTIIPLLNNCEDIRVSPSKHIYESSCPAPPYKRASGPTEESMLLQEFASKTKRTSFKSVPNVSRAFSSRQKSV